jgi:hypothetical protein
MTDIAPTQRIEPGHGVHLPVTGDGGRPAKVIGTARKG